MTRSTQPAWTATSAARRHIGMEGDDNSHHPVLDALGVVHASGVAAATGQLFSVVSRGNSIRKVAVGGALRTRVLLSIVACLVRMLEVAKESGVANLCLDPRYVVVAATPGGGAAGDDDDADETAGDDDAAEADGARLPVVCFATRLAHACHHSGRYDAAGHYGLGAADFLPEVEAASAAPNDARLARAVDPVTAAAAALAAQDAAAAPGGGDAAAAYTNSGAAYMSAAALDRFTVALHAVAALFPKEATGPDAVGFLLETAALLRKAEGPAGGKAVRRLRMSLRERCGGAAKPVAAELCADGLLLDVVALLRELVAPRGGHEPAALLDMPAFAKGLGVSGDALRRAVDTGSAEVQGQASAVWTLECTAGAFLALAARVRWHLLPRLAALGEGTFGAAFVVRAPLALAPAPAPAAQAEAEAEEGGPWAPPPPTAAATPYCLKVVKSGGHEAAAGTTAGFLREAALLQRAEASAPGATSALVAAAAALSDGSAVPWAALERGLVEAAEAAGAGADLLGGWAELAAVPTELVIALRLYEGGSADAQSRLAWREVREAFGGAAAAGAADEAARAELEGALDARRRVTRLALTRKAGSELDRLRACEAAVENAELCAARAAQSAALARTAARACGRRVVRWAARCLFAVLMSLERLHAGGVAAMDVKPANVLVATSFSEGTAEDEDAEGRAALRAAAAADDGDNGDGDGDGDGAATEEEQEEEGDGDGQQQQPPVCARARLPVVVSDLGMAVRLDADGRLDRQWAFGGAVPRGLLLGGTPGFVSGEVVDALASPPLPDDDGGGSDGDDDGDEEREAASERRYGSVGAPADVYAAAVTLLHLAWPVDGDGLGVGAWGAMAAPRAGANAAYDDGFRPLDPYRALRRRGLIDGQGHVLAGGGAGPFADLLAGMLDASPATRLTAAQARAHPFFNEAGAVEQLLDHMGLLDGEAGAEGRPTAFDEGQGGGWLRAALGEEEEGEGEALEEAALEEAAGAEGAAAGPAFAPPAQRQAWWHDLVQPWQQQQPQTEPKPAARGWVVDVFGADGAAAVLASAAAAEQRPCAPAAGGASVWAAPAPEAALVALWGGGAAAAVWAAPAGAWAAFSGAVGGGAPIDFASALPEPGPAAAAPSAAAPAPAPRPADAALSAISAPELPAAPAAPAAPVMEVRGVAAAAGRPWGGGDGGRSSGGVCGGGGGGDGDAAARLAALEGAHAATQEHMYERLAAAKTNVEDTRARLAAAVTDAAEERARAAAAEERLRARLAAAEAESAAARRRENAAREAAREASDARAAELQARVEELEAGLRVAAEEAAKAKAEAAAALAAAVAEGVAAALAPLAAAQPAKEPAVAEAAEGRCPAPPLLRVRPRSARLRLGAAFAATAARASRRGPSSSSSSSSSPSRRLGSPLVDTPLRGAGRGDRCWSRLRVHASEGATSSDDGGAVSGASGAGERGGAPLLPPPAAPSSSSPSSPFPPRLPASASAAATLPVPAPAAAAASLGVHPSAAAPAPAAAPHACPSSSSFPTAAAAAAFPDRAPVAFGAGRRAAELAAACGAVGEGEEEEEARAGAAGAVVVAPEVTLARGQQQQQPEQGRAVFEAAAAEAEAEEGEEEEGEGGGGAAAGPDTASPEEEARAGGGEGPPPPGGLAPGASATTTPPDHASPEGVPAVVLRGASSSLCAAAAAAADAADAAPPPAQQQLHERPPPLLISALCGAIGGAWRLGRAVHQNGLVSVVALGISVLLAASRRGV